MPHRKTYKPPPQYRGRESNLPSTHIGRLDLIIGEIRDVVEHPKYMSNFYVGTVNVGKLFSTLIETGLAIHFPPEDLIGRKVVLCNNVQPLWVKTRDIYTCVMVARTGDHPEIVELLIPPDDAEPGDQIHVEGFAQDPDRPCLNPYKDVFDQITSFIRIDDDLNLIYKNKPLTIKGKGGTIKTAGLRTLCFIDVM